jgi:hypothetical protein
MPENLQFTEINVKGFVIRESKILFTSLRVIGLFLRSEAPGLVFSAASHQSLQKNPTTLVFLDIPCKQFDGPSSKRVAKKEGT